LDGHQDWVRDVAFSPDGDLLVTASDDFWARVWPTDRREEPVVLSGHRDYIYGATFSPGGEFVLTASRDGTARIWLVSTTALLARLRGETRICLTPEQRMRFLLESRSIARAKFGACERRHGRGGRAPSPPG
jgi:WD40 repeat protein